MLVGNYEYNMRRPISSSISSDEDEGDTTAPDPDETRVDEEGEYGAGESTFRLAD